MTYGPPDSWILADPPEEDLCVKHEIDECPDCFDDGSAWAELMTDADKDGA
jgi:hypothetical protein